MRRDSQAGDHLGDEQIIALLHGAATGEEASHLKNCSKCRSELEAYQATLQCLNQWSAPERGAEYGERVWRQIANRMPRPKRHRWISVPVMAWATVAACGAVLLLGLLVRQKPREAAPAAGVVAEAPAHSQRLLNAALGDHLERASILLTSVLNERGTFKHDATVFDEDERLDDLIAENRLYRQTAEQQNDLETAALLGDVETVLLDLQHSATAAPASELRYVQQRISDSSLRFRVGIVRSGAGQQPAQAANVRLVGRGL
jgi:hypothetical protein